MKTTLHGVTRKLPKLICSATCYTSARATLQCIWPIYSRGWNFWLFLTPVRVSAAKIVVFGCVVPISLRCARPDSSHGISWSTRVFSRGKTPTGCSVTLWESAPRLITRFHFPICRHLFIHITVVTTRTLRFCAHEKIHGEHKKRFRNQSSGTWRRWQIFLRGKAFHETPAKFSPFPMTHRILSRPHPRSSFNIVTSRRNPGPGKQMPPIEILILEAGGYCSRPRTFRKVRTYAGEERGRRPVPETTFVYFPH